MAYITGQTVHGCSTPAKYLGGNTYECAPDVGEFYKEHRIYNDYHMWYAKVTGEVGETVTVRLKWPQFDPDAVSAEYRAWATYSADWPSFFYALHEVLYISTDERVKMSPASVPSFSTRQPTASRGMRVRSSLREGLPASIRKT